MNKEAVSKLSDFIVRNDKNIQDAVVAGAVILGGRVAQTAAGLETGGPEIAFVATLTTGVAVKATRKVLDKVSTRCEDQK